MKQHNHPIRVQQIKEGLALGFATGAAVSFFEAFYMLTNKVYVPLSYPLTLLLYNLSMWMVFGTAVGIFKQYGKIRKVLSLLSEHNQWIVCFVIPFLAIYGFMGRIKFMIGSVLAPVFDYHLSFLWVALMVCYALRCSKRVAYPSRAVHMTVILEIVMGITIFPVCSNIDRIPLFNQLIESIFAQDSTFFSLEVNLNIKQYLGFLYMLFVISVGTIYVKLLFPFKTRLKKPLAVLAILSVLAMTSLTSCYIYSKTLFEKNISIGTSSSVLGPQTPPYVFLIVLDTVRADYLSLYGGNSTTTNLDSIAQEGLVFENCIASSPWTLPSHASLFTGYYPNEHGMHYDQEAEKREGGITPLKSRILSEKFVTLAEIFQNNGYRTAGVVSNYVQLKAGYDFDRGFNIYDDYKSIGYIYKHYPFQASLHLLSYLTNIQPKRFTQRCRTAEDINSSLHKIVDTARPEPFFIFANYMDAHAPYLAPYPFNPIGYSFFKKAMQKVKRLSKKDLVSQEVTGYKREIEYLDSKLGTLFTLLKRKGIYNEALIVITSDHGELFGEHGYLKHNCPMYEGVIKVPLIIKYPFNSKTGRITQPITLTDLFSTILSICDLPIPQNVSGIPFGSALQPVVSELYKQKLGAHRTLRLGDYKFMHYEKGKDPELYHVKEDSRELKNLMQKKPDIAREYENLLEDWLQQHTPQYTESKTMKFIVPQETIEGLRDLGYIE